MKPCNEVREGKRKEQMRRGRKESIYLGLPLLFLHLLAYLPDAEKFSLCYANIALVSTNGMAVPTLPTARSRRRLLTQVEAPSQQNRRSHLYSHSL